MKGMTPRIFGLAAPCAVDSHSTSEGISAPNSCSINLTESLENNRIGRYLYRKFREEPTPAIRCDRQGGFTWPVQHPIFALGAVQMVGQSWNSSTQRYLEKLSFCPNSSLRMKILSSEYPPCSCRKISKRGLILNKNPNFAG